MLTATKLFDARGEHVRVRRPDALHQLEHRTHLRRIGDELRHAVAAKRLILALEALALAEGTAHLDRVAQDRQEA
jgi:hypothetical protein